MRLLQALGLRGALLPSLAAALSASLAGCAQPAAPGVKSVPEVVFKLRSGQDLHVTVEVARRDPERQRGLMFRQKLEPGTGMLFLFEAPGPLTFWMKNTYIALDMLFFDENRRLIYIEENAEPLTTIQRGPRAPAQYVLEVPGGWARAQGIELGLVAEFKNL